MTPLSTLTPEALHALVAQSLEGVTEGPWFAKAYRSRETSSEKPEVWLRSEKTDIACLVDSELDRDLCFAAQSRDIVPELDRRLREAETKLEVAMKYLKSNPHEFWCSVHSRGGGNCTCERENVLTRIANLTQP
jgi:hypothetical protein